MQVPPRGGAVTRLLCLRSILLAATVIALVVASTGGVSARAPPTAASPPRESPPANCDPPAPAVVPLVTPIVEAAVALNHSDVGIDLDFCSTISGVSGTYTLNWSFGDDTYNHIRDPVHIYIAPANYTVVLTLNSTDYNTTSTIYAVVNASVEGSSGYSPAAPTTADNVTFTDSPSLGVPPYAVFWSFGDRTIATGTSAHHTYATAGSYMVQVWTNDSGGGSVLKTFQVNVTKAPVSNPFLGGSTGILIGVAVAAVAVSLVGYAYLQYEKKRRPKLPTPASPPSP